MRILLTGATGFIGSALHHHLTKAGHQVVPLARGVGAGPVWDPASGTINLAPAGPLDAVIHLAGKNIAAGRWTTRRKAGITTSRVAGTTLLARAVAALTPRPATLIAASGIGYYGNCADRPVTETAPPGSDFLATLCRNWESATAPAAAAGLRVVHARIGMVLHPSGGALARMLPAFQFGLGGRLGHGRQYVSWITLPDLLAAFTHLLATPTLTGPINLVAPNPVTNRDFTRALARALRRPAILPAPAPLLRLALGEMADGLLLSSTRALPARLLNAGFTFRDPELEPALRALIG